MGALVTHTSGNTSLDVLKKYFSRTGLFYPLQSFSTGSEVVWDNLPVFIQADNEPDMEWLHEIGRGIGGNTISIREDQRSYLHMAAVIANNFPNALFNWAKQILDSNDLAFEYLHPLILDGLKKSLLLGPDKAQTGPAQRGDSNTVRQHLDMLGSEPEKRALYKALSLLINPDLKINEE